ncbi:MAG: CotH kinase family protein [Prevotellaceae bacterium]|nr:CotH kinase family protein [Prevotellaceae bacterium]
MTQQFRYTTIIAVRLLALLLLLITPALFTSCSDDNGTLPQDPADGSHQGSTPQNDKLPIVYLTTPDSQPITSKTEYMEHATVRIEAPDSQTLLNDYIMVRGRGNSSWSAPKKPYIFKFDDKQSVLSMAKDKTWVLLANYYDPTLLRNDLAFWIGNEMSTLEWTPSFRMISFVLNGEPKGIYQLGEKPKISKNRLNLGDTGFLLEIDGKATSDEITFRTPHLLRPVNIKDPDIDLNSADYIYVRDHIIDIEAALYANNYTDPVEGWRKYMDEDSFVEWYIINELAKNADAIFFTSCYMYFTPNSKLKMGPLWDFDIAFGGYPWPWEKTYEIANNPEGFYINSATWYQRLFADPAFVVKVKERFAWYYDNRQRIYDHIDQTAEQIEEYIVADNQLWGTITPTDSEAAQTLALWHEHIDNMKQWIESRFTWLHQNLSQLQ